MLVTRRIRLREIETSPECGRSVQHDYAICVSTGKYQCTYIIFSNPKYFLWKSTILAIKSVTEATIRLHQ